MWSKYVKYNEVFIIEPVTSDTGVFSACTGIWTCNLYSCTGDTNINNSVYVFGDVSANTYYGDVSANSINSDYISISGTDILTLIGNSNYYTTASTLYNKIAYYDRSDILSAYTLDLSSFAYQLDLNTHTGDTSNPHNTTASQVGAYSASQVDSKFVYKSGDTMTGNLVVPIISADTIFSGGTNLLEVIGGSEKFTTASTLFNKTVYFNRNDGLSAYTSDLSSLAYDSDLSSHTGNTNNPHNVTAVQISAYTKTEIDGLISKITITGITSSTIIELIPDTLTFGAVWNYIIKSNTNDMRAGTFMGVWESVSNLVEFYETTTNDIGDTSGFSFSANVISNNARLIGTPTGGTWTVVVSRVLL